MEILEIYNDIVFHDFFNIVKIFDPGWVSANKVFYININKFVVDYEPIVYDVINLYWNYLRIS